MGPCPLVTRGLVRPVTPGSKVGHPIDVTVAAGSVQLSGDGQVIRVQAIRHDRARELSSFANPKGRPRRKPLQPAMPPGYRNRSVAWQPELDIGPHQAAP
jgi:hypothetical protein